MMRFVRRQYLIGSVVALGSGVAAACDREEAPPPAATPPPPRRVPITALPTPRPGSVPLRMLFGPWPGLPYSEIPMTFYRSDHTVMTPQQALYRATAFATFQERYSDNHVIFDTTHDPLPVLQAAHAADDAPDLFYMDDRRGRAVVRHGMAARLDGRVRQWPDLADFVRPALAAGQNDRQQWGLPLFTSVYTLYYNQALLRALGILRIPTTWEDFLFVAEQSTRVDGDRVVRQGVNKPDAQWFWWLLQSTGATLYRDGSAGFGSEVEEVLLFLRQLYHAVQPAGVASPQSELGDVGFFFTSHLWDTGQLAHAWLPVLPAEARRRADSSRWTNPARSSEPSSRSRTITTVSSGEVATVRALYKQGPPPEDIAVGGTPIPGTRYALPANRQTSPLVHTHSAVLHLSSQSEHPDLAWELLMLLLEPDTLYEYANLRRAMPPRQSILRRGYLDNPKTQQVVDLWLRYGRPPFDPPLYDRVQYWIGQAFGAAVVRQEDIGKAARELAKQLNKIAAEADPPFTGTTRT